MKERLALETPGNYELNPPMVDIPEAGLSNFREVLQWGTTMLMIISVFLATFFLIWGGIQWIMSGGNKDKIHAAQQKIIYATIGLVVIFSSFLIINIVSGIFGVDFFS
jgi:hypothetical protein